MSSCEFVRGFSFVLGLLARVLNDGVGLADAGEKDSLRGSIRAPKVHLSQGWMVRVFLG